jgi:PAS domain S-box-containing protein
MSLRTLKSLISSFYLVVYEAKVLTASVSNSEILTLPQKKRSRPRKTRASPTIVSDESTKLLALAEEVAHFGSWEFDTSKPRAIWSPELFRIFGIEPKAQGLTWEEYTSFIHPDDLPMAKKNMEIMLNAGLNHREVFDYRIIRPDGSVRTIHSQRQVREVTPEGKTRIIVGVDQDLTERKQAEEALKLIIAPSATGTGVILAVFFDRLGSDSAMAVRGHETWSAPPAG